MDDEAWVVKLNCRAVSLKLPLIVVFTSVGMWPWSECAREAIDAAINAVVKSKSKLAKNLLFGLRIPGKCVLEGSRVRGGQSESPCVNVVAEGHAPTLREIDYSLHRVLAGRAFSILFTARGISEFLCGGESPEVTRKKVPEEG